MTDLVSDLTRTLIDPVPATMTGRAADLVAAWTDAVSMRPDRTNADRENAVWLMEARPAVQRAMIRQQVPATAADRLVELLEAMPFSPERLQRSAMLLDALLPAL